MKPDGVTRLRILNAEPGRFSEQACAALRALGEVTEAEADRAFLLERLADYDVLVVALRNPIDADILSRAERLRCIVSPTTGLNHIDLAAAEAQGVTVLSLLGESEFLDSITATAELTWGLLLSLLRRIPAAHTSVVDGRWQRDAFYGRELSGKTLGVLGYGRLGKMVAAYGAAFRMSVVAFDKVQRPGGDAVEFVTLTQLLTRSDVVSLHLPLNDETKGLFDARAFQSMKHGSVFINTARGEIVDQAALLAALRSGHLAGAAVDVLEGETSTDPHWLDAHPLAAYARTHDNLLITPHVGGVTHESVEKTNLFMIRKLQHFLAHRHPA